MRITIANEEPNIRWTRRETFEVGGDPVAEANAAAIQSPGGWTDRRHRLDPRR
ncbi:hypothetical protein [Aquisphaera insulae]|uniref:hypothetical protein n=1 Tax=Aquisphaera insulae TaxID=2712864 RepID=UPI0013EBE17C|nr:hypothetical protein [Aquisphaera insulae]